MDAKLKQQIIKSISAIACVGMVCYTIVGSSGKLADVITAGSTPSEETGEDLLSSFDDVSNGSSEVVSYDNTATDNGQSADNSSVPEASNSTEATTAVTGTTDNSSSGVATTKAQTKSSVPSTKAEIIEYCNTALNNAKAAKPGYTKKYVRKCSGDLPSIVLNLIKQNETTTAAKGSDNKDDFPAGGFTWSSKLRESDVADAKLKQNGQYYEILLKLGKETNPGKGETSSYGRAMTVVTQDDAKAMLSAIKTVTLNYHDGYVYAKVDIKTGKLVKAEFSATVDLSANISVLGDLKADNVTSTETFTNFVW